MADAFAVAPLTAAGIRTGRPGAAAQSPSPGRAQSTTLYNGQFVSGPGDQRAPGFTGFQGSGPRGGGGGVGGGGVSDEDAWFQEQVRQAQEQQGGGGSSQGRVFVDMGELEEKQRREEERRMQMEDETRMPMPGGGQPAPWAAGSSPFASDFASQVREAAKDPRQRGAITNKNGRVFVDMDELERQKEREDEERMRREKEREKREMMEKEMRREASKGPGPRPPAGPRGRPGPMGGGPMGVATAAAAGLAAAMFQSDDPPPPPTGSRDSDDGDADFGDSGMMSQSGPPPPFSMQSSSFSPNPLAPYEPSPTEPSDADNPSPSTRSLSAPNKSGAVVKLDDKTKMTVDIISGKCDKISSAADVINSKSDGIQVCFIRILSFNRICSAGIPSRHKTNTRAHHFSLPKSSFHTQLHRTQATCDGLQASSDVISAKVDGTQTVSEVFP